MVVRKQKRSRKYFGTRRWGVGNIKNARGAGDRGGVGRAGARKHNFTYMTSKAREEMHRRGFHPWRQSTKYNEITLGKISSMAESLKEGDSTIELKGYKVLSNGVLTKPLKISASGFSKSAEEKIKSAGGEALVIGKQ
ncbi:MAG: uL15 family ribosomal protein [Candidatus Marsarchaeota archaeon]|jgi:large subunit ribosomal protein L15|nr:uL15 family ribosomal protein [Candidatus Marsarchaeota archaeon]MCL5115209.1 uL15 family ribosomal protein [Candidatus Marsarchaeota archaeon]